MMAVIVALFMGLTVGAEEIIKDRKILKREIFLNLSWNSYLMSKMSILFTLSAIQTIIFIVVGNWILEIHNMNMTYWLVLFSVSCTANMIGLNISSAFNSTVTVYILIPILIIPQMVLSGLLFSFDKLNEVVSTKGKVPIVADLMASRWAYEALAVRQFITNEYESKFYDFERTEFQSDFKHSYWVKELEKRLHYVIENFESYDDEKVKKAERYLSVIRHELAEEAGSNLVRDLDLRMALSPEAFDVEIGTELLRYLDELYKKYLDEYNLAIQKKDKLIYAYTHTFNHNLNEEKDHHYNESLADLVRNLTTKERIIEFKGQLLQIVDPVFNEPGNPKNQLDYRAHFFAPKKHFFNTYFNTYWFNVAVLWIMTFMLYVALYFELLKKLINSSETLGSTFTTRGLFK
jgi:hypothetical protein